MKISKEKARQHYIERIAKAYGHERVKDLLPLQKSKLEASLNRLFEERFENIDDIAQYIKKNMYKMPNLFINRQQLGDGIEFSGTCVLDEFLSNQVHKSL